MTYEELQAAGARTFITEGPNSEGQGGFIVLGTQVYPVSGDWGSGPELFAPMAGREFIKRYEASTNQRIQQVVAFIRQRLELN